MSIHDDVNLASLVVVKPSYSSMMKRGVKSAPTNCSVVQRGVQRSAPLKRLTFTLDKHKLYLESAATYPIMFCKWYLMNVRAAGLVLCGNYNADTPSTSTKGTLGIFDPWVNEKGTANLLSIPQL